MELDLTEAIKAGCDGWEGDYSITAAVEAAAPIIERQVRERVAEALDAERLRVVGRSGEALTNRQYFSLECGAAALATAAEIARGEQDD